MKACRTSFGNSPVLLLTGMILTMALHSEAQIPWPEILVLEPAKDTSLYSEGDLSNGSGIAIFSGLTKGNQGAGARRALIQFDVATAIPPGSIIESATLRLYCSKRPQDDFGDNEFALHRVLRAWGEGTSDAGDFGGKGASASEGDATWNHAVYPSEPWTFPGGDFDPLASASEVVSGIGVYTWSGEQLIQDVQDWVDQPETNFGWILIGDETLVSARRFESREYPDSRFRPLLLIDYSLTWAGFPYPPGSPVVDTGDFLGFIDIRNDPWIYVYLLNKFIFAPENYISEAGGWVWIGN